VEETTLTPTKVSQTLKMLLNTPLNTPLNNMPHKPLITLKKEESEELQESLEDKHQLSRDKAKLLTPLLTLEKKSSRENPELNTFHSKEKSLNTRTRPELKEFQEPEKLLNIENKKESNKSQEKSQKPTIMPLNISGNTFHNTSLKKPSNTLLEKEKLKSTNTFQSKDKLSTIQNNHLKSPHHLPTKPLDIKFQEDNKSLDKQLLTVDTKLDTKPDTKPATMEATLFTKLVIKKCQLDIKLDRNTCNKCQVDTQTPNTLLEDQVFTNKDTVVLLQDNKSTQLVLT